MSPSDCFEATRGEMVDIAVAFSQACRGQTPPTPPLKSRKAGASRGPDQVKSDAQYHSGREYRHRVVFIIMKKRSLY